MNPRSIASVLFVLGSMLGARIGVAVARPVAPPATIQVSGDATVTRAPDRVQVDVGVVTRSESSRAAAGANARKTTAVIDALRQAIAEEDVELYSMGYSLHPEYRRADDAEPSIIGYTARNTVRIVLDDVDRIGDAIDIATRAGANQVQRVTFSLQDEAAARAAALEAAIAEARATADRVAASLSVRIVGVRAVVVAGSPVQPMRELAMARTTGPTETPILSGPIEVHASVNVTFDVLPAGRD